MYIRRVCFLFSFAILLIAVPRVGSTSYIWIPVATRVQSADLIVIGRVVADAKGEHKPEMYCGPNEATFLVRDVVMGTIEAPGKQTSVDGTTSGTIRVRHWEEWSADTGNFHDLPPDDRFKDEIDGIWMLWRSDEAGTYCAIDPAPLRLGELDYVRKCIHTLETRYADYKPGITPDVGTWVDVFLSENTYVDTCVHETGEITVHGSFRGKLSVSDQTLLDSGDQYDDFVARLDGGGHVKWVRALGTGQKFTAHVIAGHDGDCLLVGDLHAQTNVLGGEAPCSRKGSRLVVCVSPDGDVKWMRCLTPGARPDKPPPITSPDWPCRIDGLHVLAVPNGYCLVASFCGEVLSGETSVASADRWAWLIGSIQDDGKSLRIECVDRDSEDHITDITGAPGGDMVITGDRFIARVSAQGQPVWMTSDGGRLARISDVAVGRDGTVVACASHGGASQTLTAWSAAGKVLWRTDVAGGDDVEIGDDGNVYLAGSYTNQILMRDKMPAVVGNADLFLACYDRAGRRLWVRADGGLTSEYVREFYLLPGRRALLAGRFDGTTYLAGKAVIASTRPLHRNAFVMNVPLP